MDLREQFIQVPHQKCITRDNAPVDVDCLIYMYVVDAVDSVVQVQNYLGAAQGIAMTTLRSVVGDISLDDVLAKREQINTVLRTKLDEVTERWGVKVNSVEIREIIPPREVQEAMNRQMSAERNRRAVVTEAEGKREAAVTVATGEKQAAILASEGARQSSILRAEGSAQALGDGLLGGHDDRHQDDEPAIPGHAAIARGRPGDQVRDPDGVYLDAAAAAESGRQRRRERDQWHGATPPPQPRRASARPPRRTGISIPPQRTLARSRRPRRGRVTALVLLAIAGHRPTSPPGSARRSL